MTCISNVKFSMVATVVRDYKKNVYKESGQGYDELIYDVLTGEKKKVWVATDLIDDNISVNKVTTEVPCLVLANYTVTQDNDLKYSRTRILDTERLTMKTPSRYHLFTTDRVVAIRNSMGELLYEDDQVPTDNFDSGRPAEYNIVGVLPIFDPFGRVVERQVALEKANS